VLYQLGKYFMLVGQVFRKPEKYSIFFRQLLTEVNSLGIGSLGIVSIISVFMGAVITIQSAYNFTSAWIPIYAIGMATRQGIILEFAPTIISLILAGKVGSSIASEIGTMRVTEQIDALEVMGINPAGYLIFPKILAAMVINPFLVVISMFLGIFGGWLFGVVTGVVSSYAYQYGVQYEFNPFSVYYALIKTVVFAFLITSVSAFYGYYTSGGALEVGRSSTKAVVSSSILILIFNFLLTQLLMS
jgi:phospholipid/cholesterol/gamma-HCH transport system permease protein